MRNLLASWRDEIARNPVVLAPLVALGAVMSMNARTGYALANKSYIMGIIFVAIAVLTAYAATKGLEMPKGGPHRGRRRALIAWAVVGFFIDQFCGWQTFGLLFADGQVARDTKGQNVAALRADIGRLQAERASLVIPRPVAAIEPEEQRECKLAPKGIDPVGPKCTALRVELGKAKRAAEIDDKELPAKLQQLASGDQVAEGQVQFLVPLKLARAAVGLVDEKTAKRIQGRHILFGFELIMVAVLGVASVFGFWLVGTHGAGDEDDARDYSPLRLAGPPVRPALVAPSVPLSGDGWDGPRGGGSPPGAPITVNVGVPQIAAPAAQSDAARAASVEPGVKPPAPAVLVPARDRRDLAGLPSDAPPVDRSRVTRELSPDEREPADVVLAFAAACVVDAPGAMVTLTDLHRRYAAWAGERALGRDVFARLFADVAGVAIGDIAGTAHARGIALRAAPPLKAVG